jgi:hypothetical protein
MSALGQPSVSEGAGPRLGDGRCFSALRAPADAVARRPQPPACSSSVSSAHGSISSRPSGIGSPLWIERPKVPSPRRGEPANEQLLERLVGLGLDEIVGVGGGVCLTVVGSALRPAKPPQRELRIVARLAEEIRCACVVHDRHDTRPVRRQLCSSMKRRSASFPPTITGSPCAIASRSKSNASSRR